MFNAIVSVFVAIGMSMSAAAYNTYVEYEKADVVLAPVAQKVENSELQAAKAAMRARLDMAGLTEVKVQIENNTIEIRMPSEDMRDKVQSALLANNIIELKEPDGNVVLDMNDIESAEGQFGPISDYGNYEHYVSITFTDEGRKKFKEATIAAVERMATGENYITINLNGEVVSNPIVSAVIDSQTCIISGSFTMEEAKNLEQIINSGNVPFELKVVE